MPSGAESGAAHKVSGAPRNSADIIIRLIIAVDPGKQLKKSRPDSLGVPRLGRLAGILNRNIQEYAVRQYFGYIRLKRCARPYCTFRNLPMGIGLRMVTFANQAGESILLHSDIIRMIFRRQKIMWFKRCADLLIQALYDRLNFLGRNRLSTLHAALQ